MWPVRWACRGARSRSGGAAGAPRARPGWRIAARGRTARLGAPQRESRSASVVWVAAPGEARCIWGARTGVSASTVWRILQRNGLNRLAWIDRPTGRVIRRYERSEPGELVHLDIKKIGQIPPGWRVHGRGSPQAKRKPRPVGYTYLHVAIDDHSRVAYVEAHDDETAKTLVKFWRRAQDWFWANDMAVDEVLTDNGPNFVSDAFAEILAERRIEHRRTRPSGTSHPSNSSDAANNNPKPPDSHNRSPTSGGHITRTQIRGPPQLHDYNRHRHHTAVGGPPASRANNLTRTDT